MVHEGNEMARTILIYGGSGGIGSAIARSLHARGDSLFLVGRDEGRLAEVAADVDARWLAGDVTGEGFCERVMEAVGADLDGLVYSVGSLNLASIRRLKAEDYLRDFRLNALGGALAVQAGCTALRKSKGGGSVVLFSSVAAQRGFPLHSSISMAKGAVSGLTVALAAELAPKIRVNAIAPSLTETPLAENLLASSTVADSVAAQHPLKRLGTPADSAELAVFLLSGEASWITGQIFGVDGGRSTLQAGS